MSQKYKIKRKRKTKAVYIIFALVILLIFLSAVYAIWSETLTVTGSATAKYVEPELEITVPKDGNGKMVSHSSLTHGIFNISYASFDREELVDNKLTVWFKLSSTNVNINPVDFTGGFKLYNDTNYQFTNGTVTYTLHGTSGDFSNLNNYSTTGTINVGATGTFTTSIKLRPGQIGSGKQGSILYKISYMVDGLERFFYYEVIFFK